MKKLLASFLLLCTPLQAQESDLFYRQLVYTLAQFIGTKEFPRVNGFKYNEDCSGFVAFIFHATGLNLVKTYGKGSSGVSAIWNGMKNHELLLDHENLQAGDIVFFDNTYDKNRNGIWDDKLSHIGIVESVDENGTATYVHYGSRGVARAKMNLSHPKVYNQTVGKTVTRYNDIIRNSRKKGVNPHYLSGALYKGAARIPVQKKG